MSNFSQKRHFCAGPQEISLSVQHLLSYIKLCQTRSSPNTYQKARAYCIGISAFFFTLLQFALSAFLRVFWRFCFSFITRCCKSFSKYYTYYIIAYPIGFLFSPLFSGKIHSLTSNFILRLLIHYTDNIFEFFFFDTFFLIAVLSVFFDSVIGKKTGKEREKKISAEQ